LFRQLQQHPIKITELLANGTRAGQIGHPMIRLAEWLRNDFLQA
jgi:hypothetical protein